MAVFEHPLQLFTLEYPDAWELRYQEETGGVLLIHADLREGSAFSVTPLAVMGEGAPLLAEVERIAGRLGVALEQETLREETAGETRRAYGEGRRPAAPGEPPSAPAASGGTRFRLWVLRHGALTLHIAHLGPGADTEAGRRAADSILASLAFPELLPPTPQEFRNRVLSILAREYPAVRPLPAGDWSIELLDEQGAPARTLGLENLYRSCLLNAESAGALIRDYLDQVLGASESPEIYADYRQARGRILPMLKSVEWRESVPESFELAWIDYAPGLVLCFAIDEPSRMIYVTHGMLRNWNLPLERIQGVALDNLAALMPQVEMTLLPGPGGETAAVIVSTGDGYDAARLVLPAVRETFARQLGDDYLVGLPNRDFLIAFSERRSESLTAEIVRRVRADFHKMHHPITSTIYRVRAERIEPATEWE